MKLRIGVTQEGCALEVDGLPDTIAPELAHLLAKAGTTAALTERPCSNLLERLQRVAATLAKARREWDELESAEQSAGRLLPDVLLEDEVDRVPFVFEELGKLLLKLEEYESGKPYA